MKAVRFHGKHDVRVEDIPEPTVGPGQVKLRNAYAGICGSDLHFYFYPESLPFDFSKPHPVTGATLPQVLGHEFSGTVVEVGPDVTDVQVGDRAAVFPLVKSCGHCAPCRAGKPFICHQIGALGATAPGGGLSEYVTVNAGQLHKLPDNVDLRMGALVEPLAVGWHGVARTNAEPGDTALVAGAGPVGFGAWFALKARGVERILVSEPNVQRREAIAKIGADVVDPADDLAAAIAKFTDGEGVKVAVDAAGAGPAATGAIAGLMPGGRLSVVALHENPVELSLTQLMMSELEVVGAVGYEPQEFDEVITAMADGFYDTTGWVEERPFDGIIDAFHDLRNGVGGKVLLRVS